MKSCVNVLMEELALRIFSGRILAIQIQPEPHQNQTAQNLQNILISLYKIDDDRHA